MIRRKQKTWLEADGIPGPPVRVAFESVDPGGGEPARPAVRIGHRPKWNGFQQQVGVAQPAEYLISVKDLKELVRLAEEPLGLEPR